MFHVDMRLSSVLVCVLALAAMGCTQTAAPDGGGGDGGSAGVGGSSGSSGVGGGGSAGGPVVSCLPTEDRCVNSTTEAHEPCCEQTVPNQANACDGTESTENPATCAPTGNAVTYRLTLMEIEDDCNVGYDLDDCDGTSCVEYGHLRPADGLSGVDNALAGWGVFLEGISEHLNLGFVNQGFADALCGATDDPSAGTCRGGNDDGSACTRDDPCPGAGAFCDFSDDDCLLEIVPIEIRFAIDANPNEGCANVTVLTDGEASPHILNFSDDGCASGTLGAIPIAIRGAEGSLANTVVRMTVSSAGFSHGQLGAAIEADLTVGIVELFPITDLAGGLDISASAPPTRDTSAWCDALSATFVIGGVAE